MVVLSVWGDSGSCAPPDGSVTPAALNRVPERAAPDRGRFGKVQHPIKRHVSCGGPGSVKYALVTTVRAMRSPGESLIKGEMYERSFEFGYKSCQNKHGKYGVLNLIPYNWNQGNPHRDWTLISLCLRLWQKFLQNCFSIRCFHGVKWEWMGIKSILGFAVSQSSGFSIILVWDI